MADKDGDGIPDSIDKNPNTRDANPSPKWGGVTNAGGGFVPNESAASSGMVWVHDPRVTTGANPGFSRMSASDAKQWYQYFPQTFPELWNGMVQPLIRTGIVQNTKDAVKKLQSGVEWAALGLGGENASAWDYLAIAPSTEGDGGAKTTTQAVQYTPQSIKGVGNNVWMSELGREMTDKEAKAMAKLFNAESRKSPNVYAPSTQTVGMSPEVFLQEQARSQEGYAERQVGVRFMDILDKFISNPTATEQIAMEG